LKTTKTIAAVLAVFLVAALFIGAASAADPAAGDTVYVYQYNATNASTSYYLWESGSVAGIVKSDSVGTISGESVVAGLYSNNSTVASNLFTIKYPSLALAIYKANTGTSIADTTILKSQDLDFALTGNNSLNYSIAFTTPAGGSTYDFGENPVGTSLSWNETAAKITTDVNITNVTSGTWTAKASFATNSTQDLIKTTPSKYLDSNKVSFTVGADTTDSISINKDTIVRGSSVLVTVTGEPQVYVNVTINEAGFLLLAGQDGVNGYSGTDGYLDVVKVKLGDTGSKVFQINTDSSTAIKTYTLTTNQTPEKKATVAVQKGVMTVTAAQGSYPIGEDIILSGTNTETDAVYLFISGLNIDKESLAVDISVKDDDTWTSTFNPSSVYKDAHGVLLDAGTYTIYASTYVANTSAPVFSTTYVYSSVSVALKQPFLSATAASSTVAEGDDMVITGTAEATNDLRYYIFGANKFLNGSISVNDDATFTAEIDTTGLAAGQYFVVIQHKMDDGFYNILPFVTTIRQNPTGEANASSAIVFDTATLQNANAAQALCDAVDSQYIDDIYRKLTFIVAQPTLTMNPVSDVTKGSALKVTGITNLKVDTVVTVDVLSTAFTALDKGSASSASFITMTTKVVAGADGANTWEVTFDTTGLSVDTYTIQASVEQLSTSTIIKIIEKPTATATATATKTATATATATPTPQSPGFGAFLALAGLGAVAVLVLRRN